MATADPLEAAAVLLASARNAGDLEARTLYAATARRRIEEAAGRLDVLRRSLEAVESELVRLGKGAG